MRTTKNIKFNIKRKTAKEIDDIKKFIDNNDSNIDKQLEKLINISDELKTVILENKELQEANNELDLTNSKKYNDVANKLKSIKKTKRYKIFRKNGIISIV